MSEIKNPFLDNDLDRNDNTMSFTEANEEHNPQKAAMSENNATPPINVGNNKANGATISTQPEAFDENSVMEIKKDSNLLKSIIIALIILLILAILGLTLWNFFNKNKTKPADNKIIKQEEKMIIETPSFEMSGDRFRASSVVVE